MTASFDSCFCCPTCGLLQRLPPLLAGDHASCPRCRAVVFRQKTDSVHRTLAFAIAGLILYLPANFYPLIVVEAFGVRTVDFVWTNAAAMWGAGVQSVATVIFLLAIVFPLLKLLLLIWLSLAAVATRSMPGVRWLYRFYRILSDWWTVDVLILACLVTLIRLAQLVEASVEVGLYALAALMVLSLAASMSFDPSLLWKVRGRR